MIESMMKLTIIAKTAERESLIKELGRLGVMHMIPMHQQVSEEARLLSQKLERVEKALQILSSVSTSVSDESLQYTPDSAVSEVLQTSETVQTLKKEIANKFAQLQLQEFWGRISKADIDSLAAADVFVSFYKIQKKLISAIKADFVADCGPLTQDKNIVAVSGLVTMPHGGVEVTPPTTSNHDLECEVLHLQAELERQELHLAELSSFIPEITKLKENFSTSMKITDVIDGSYDADTLFAVSGWVPAKKQGVIIAFLMKQYCCYSFEEPKDDETPPTKVTYPKWVQSIAGLFEILNVAPGYREPDVSVFFMLFLPLFVAMIIGDAGYGLSLLAIATFGNEKLTAVAGKDKINLLSIFSIVTIIYGLLFGSFFGFSPADLIKLSGDYGLIGSFGHLLNKIALFWSADVSDFKTYLMVMSFSLAFLQLVLARLVKFVKFYPSEECIAELGWASFISGMFFLIWGLFIDQSKFPVFVSNEVIVWCLGIGLCLSAFFACPNKSWFTTRIPLGIASCLLSWISAFSDMVSYVRLMAVGMSGYFIAVTVNNLALSLCEAITIPYVGWIAFALIFVIGHAFNVVLALIAVLAHGVRLNMLEFSNNAGVQWSGVDYSPFVLPQTKGE